MAIVNPTKVGLPCRLVVSGQLKNLATIIKVDNHSKITSKWQPFAQGQSHPTVMEFKVTFLPKFQMVSP